MKDKNSFKYYIASSLSSFFVVVTLINICTFILGSIFRPDDRFGYEAFLSPVLNGFLSMIPVLVMYSRREFTLKQLIARKIIQLLLIEAIIIGFGYGSSAFDKENILLIASLAGSIFIIYLLVHLIEWRLESRTARQMNDMLREFQKRGTDRQL